MKKTLKITILVLVLLLCVSAVFLFIATVVDPPKDVSFDNPHAKVLADHNARLADECHGRNPAEVYFVYTDRMKRFSDEGDIDGKIYSEALGTFLDAYAPVYADYIMAVFKRPVWPDSTLREADSHIKEIRRINIDGRYPVLNSPANENLGKALDIIKSYRDASALAAHTVFISEKDARSTIERSKEYLNDSYLLNNTSLVNRLKALPAAIGRSHYRSILAHAKSLEYGYRTMPENELHNKLNNVHKEITVYTNLFSLYGDAPTQQPITDILDRIDREMIDYYHPQ